jgi:hypothetical protein
MSGKPTFATVPPTHSQLGQHHTPIHPPVKLRHSESSFEKRKSRHQRQVHTDGFASESEDSGRQLKANLHLALAVNTAYIEFHS